MAGFAAHIKRLLNWKIQTAAACNAKSIAAVDAAASLHPWSESQFVDTFAESNASAIGSSAHYILMTECSGLVCAFIVYSKVLDQAEILNIAVHPDHQGQGMARGLIVAAMHNLRIENAVRCLLEVRVSNAKARGLYESLEFKIDGVRKNYYPAAKGREDALLMSKILLETTEKRVPQ